MLLHSKFTKSDRGTLFDKAMKSFGKNGDRSIDVLRSGPVVQAALNITCDKMIGEMTHAENFLQRLGRLDRFGENDDVNEYVIVLTNAVRDGKSRDRSSRFLNSLRSLQSARAWYEFCLHNELPDKEILINQIYELYDQFYQDEKCRDLVRQDLTAALKDSVERLEYNLFDPVTLPTFKKEVAKIKIKKHSLRGDSCFVQMAIVKILNRHDVPEHNNKYLDELKFPNFSEARILVNANFSRHIS